MFLAPIEKQCLQSGVSDLIHTVSNRIHLERPFYVSALRYLGLFS